MNGSRHWCCLLNGQSPIGVYGSVEVRHPSPQDPDGRFILSVPAFLIPFRDNSVAAYEFAIERGTGIPMELKLRGAGGEVLQRMVYTSLHINTGVGVHAFRGEVYGDGASPFSGETSVDLRGFTRVGNGVTGRSWTIPGPGTMRRRKRGERRSQSQ
jgi:hypothetical protein